MNSQKGTIEEILSRFLQQRVAIQSVSYQPINSIVLENMSILRAQDSGYKRLVSVDKSKLTFSLVELITKGKFVLTDICLTKPVSKIVDYKFFTKTGLYQFIGVVNALFKNQSLNIKIEEGILPLYEQKDLSDYVVIDSKIKIKSKGVVSSNGSIDFRIASGSPAAQEDKLDYNFSGNFTKSGILVDNLEIEKENLYFKSWGELDGDLFRLSGSIFSVRPMGTYYLRKPKFIDKLEKILGRKAKPETQIILPSLSGLNVFDLSCLIKFIPNGLSIENLNFSLQDMPLRIKGDILFLEPIHLNLQVSSFPSQPQAERLQNSRRFDLELDGDLEDNRFNGRISLDFLAEIRANKSQETLEAKLKDFSFYPVSKNRLGLSFKEANVSCLANNNLYNVFLDNFNGLVSIENKNILSVEFLSGLFDGSIKGAGSLNASQIPFKTSLKLNIADVEANKLSSALVFLSRVYGKLSSEISYRNYPANNLEGKLSISEGYLDNLSFFGWLADFFSLPQLKKVDFDKISANFLVNDQASTLKDIALDSKDIKLYGSFELSAKDLTSGNLSLTFSRLLLDTSEKFKKLLNLLDKDALAVNFDFQLSGLYQSINFKWLQSDFKKGLQKLMPAGMERNFEQQIEDAVATISANKEQTNEGSVK
ncbi:MAG: AsmA-like C-terminal region-containing protein [Candidatus Omnitrophica bacterium]|nr:AsmA-like C-terminal region-containing protein [Candidatus Omnitrophota bacterium]